MVSKQVTIVSATGLHARPASQFVQVAKEHKSAITIKDLNKGTAPVNAKSIMMILAAGLGTGSKVEIACDGPDEQDALNAILALKDNDEALFSE
ncbi:phosphocarrier protein [Olsenella profusa DSM 13989]|uniref:Phosphocarrier protein HPr n=1 Tax=Olsenella profusa F0195 TaxID=1125712 RepID=U2TP61_9ACTN|nr:HPr family phosphocarrier protein [Olsenella profusa]ERL08225.1 phosphocarrier, HPr family [Olsenella profusa F0195]MDP9860608.1 phosphocarrier protein [Olsenella profusa DSM 13989]